MFPLQENVQSMGMGQLMGGGESVGNDKNVCLPWWKMDGEKDRAICAGTT